jgi:oligosaccharide reducing-end xylanase
MCGARKPSDRRRPRLGVAVRLATVMASFAVLGVSVSCGSTVDSVGYNQGDPVKLHPLVGPSSYPSPLHDIGKADADIASKIASTYNQLFHGDPQNQSIFFPVGTDQAKIEDTFHNDIRTEGMGLGMLISVELNKPDEFNRLWRYSKTVLEYPSGTRSGYFRSSCDTETGSSPCIDPFGMEQYVTALLFANDRWGSTGSIDYGADALALLDVMRNKEAQNGGVIGGVTNVFDSDAALPLDVPDITAAGRTRPSIEMPSHYELWAQATGDPFWSRAATSARAHWKRTFHPMTGLMPVKVTFDATPVAGSETFQPEAYRTLFNLALDQIWVGADSWDVVEANRLLTFFSSEGIDSYGSAYTLAGDELNPFHDVGLMCATGMAATISTNLDRMVYVERVWSLAPPADQGRYFDGLLDLLALMVMGGQMRVL